MQPRPLQKTVLIVEDNDLNLKLLNDLLEYHGYNVVTTNRGTAALQLVRQHQADLVLMDIQLPDISGIEAIRLLKADEYTKRTPVIAVTAFAMPEDRTKILASGADAYVAKPFRITEMLQLVERYTSPGGAT
jgi:two-component system cell cycle response regulator DivK